MCRSSSCFCDSDCYCFGDCCEDIEEICSPQSESNDCHSMQYMIHEIIFISVGNAYLHRISMDGSRIKTVYSTNSLENIIAIDYNYR
jgi:hypothetical protein